MIVRNANGHTPSLVVEDGETFTLSASKAHELGVPLLNLRPRNTLALLAMTGRPLKDVPRLGDRAFFEEVERTGGLVNAVVQDQEGTIGGYSVGYLKGILQALDPADPEPPGSVKLAIPLRGSDMDCDCNSRAATSASATVRNAAVHRSGFRERPSRASSTTDLTTHSLREMYVPAMFRKLEVFAQVVRLSDLVVGHNSTLFLDADFNFGIFNNVFAYRGSRIVQRAPYMMLDVKSTMRGGILNRFHSVTIDVLNIDLHRLAQEPGLKP